MDGRGDPGPARAPVAVLAIGGTTLAVFAFELWLAAGEGGAERIARLFESWGLVGRELLRGMARPEDVPGSIWLTPITALFLHGGLLHLAANLAVLAAFGPRLEARLGSLRFTLLYLAYGLLAAGAQVVADPSAYAATIGSSGAISGILGAWATSGAIHRERLRTAGLLVLAWIALQLGAGLGAAADGTAPVAWWAHLGGFAAGALLARPLWVRPPGDSRVRI